MRMEVLGIQNGTLTVKERGRVGGHTVDLISVGDSADKWQFILSVIHEIKCKGLI